ncbi:hypothetical protein [Chryseobacterium sp. WLY505]|uniref:hypothetical protein n=1 Tax=Chryseobacterium sp. WLY505 TaxID=3068892 RepID=UPI00279659F3|nr:hypothetical protein [Chryseobacterium sp. WLY505]MDQ1856072.1 hypothetical protein [Chryseobacterium sp. WLY505]
MEKKIVLTLLVLYSIGIYSQVGINTISTKITLDIAGNPTQSAITDICMVSGITEARLKTEKYASSDQGAFVLVTNADIAPPVR